MRIREAARYLGGSDEDLGNGIAVRSVDEVYLAGRTASFGLPITVGAFQTTKRGADDAFVARISAAATPPPIGQHRVYLPLSSR